MLSEKLDVVPAYTSHTHTHTQNTRADVAERLRRETANFMGVARASSNLAVSVFFPSPLVYMVRIARFHRAEPGSIPGRGRAPQWPSGLRRRSQVPLSKDAQVQILPVVFLALIVKWPSRGSLKPEFRVRSPVGAAAFS